MHIVIFHGGFMLGFHNIQIIFNSDNTIMDLL